MEKQRHIVFGTGPAGLTLIDRLLAAGHEVLAVNRRGEAPTKAQVIAGDVTDAAAMRSLCAGADVIYHCAHAPYEVWDETLPAMQAGFLSGASSSGARLVVVDTLYMYGPTNGVPMSEATPHAATSHKGRLRAKIADDYLRAHRDGVAQVSLARAADFYGPRVLTSALGAGVFFPALQGQPAITMGDVDLPHAYSYIEDVAAALETLGSHADAFGRAWHVPTVSSYSTRDVHRLIAKEIGHDFEDMNLPAPTDQAWGPFDETFMREYAELFYQYLEPQIVDCQAIENAFGLRPTPMATGIHNTVDWYRNQLAVPQD